MKPPTAIELVGPPPHCLDAEYALKNFLGKTQAEAKSLFRNAGYVYEDFMYMSPAGLCYYLPAALSYLESEEGSEDWGFAHGLMCSLSVQVKDFHNRGEPLQLAKKIADYCDSHRSKFDFTSDDLFDEYLRTIRTS